MTTPLYRRVLPVALALAGLCLGPRMAMAQALPATTAQQIRELIAEKDGRSRAERKIGSGLLYAAKAKRGAALTEHVNSLLSDVPVRPDGRVEIDIVGTISKALIEQVEQSGGEMLNGQVNGHVARAAVPLEAIEGLASFDEVRSIHAAMRATTHTALARKHDGLKSNLLSILGGSSAKPLADSNGTQGTTSPVTNAGSVQSQGSIAHGAERARKFFGVNGAGVKIGVLSDSDDFKEASIATGDLPPDTVTLPGQSGRPGTGEGTAMMEIVHDVAPGATLFFATAFNSPESFAENIRALRFTYGCDIIVDDIQYYFENPYQDDIIAQAVADVTADGASYFSSAGNEGHVSAGTSGTWEGDFKLATTPMPVLPSGYEVHQFAKSTLSDRIEIGGGPLILHWSDPGTLADPESSNDYDLFVLTPDMRSVAVASTDIQDGTGSPFEYLGFDIPAGYQVVVARKAGAIDRAVRIELFGGELALATDGGTYGHNSVEAAFGVAAVDVAQAAGGEFTGGTTTQVELFSADGPRRVFYWPDGTLINTSQLFKGNYGVVRRKPDLAAADGVATTLPASSGLNPFFGTSAAAPHAAAIAGLLISAKPTLTPAKMRSALTQSAIDIGGVGRDSDSGFGIVSAFGALTFIKATPLPFLELGTITTSESAGDGDAFIEPGETAAVSVQLLNNGGAPASSLIGQLTTSTPGVSLVNGSSTWPTIASGGSATSTVPFSFSLAPSVACGLRADFNLTTTFSGPGSPKSFSFSAATGKPSTTPALFSYIGPRAAIPDGNAAGVNIPLTVSGMGTISSLDFSFDGGPTCSATSGSASAGLDHSWVGDLTVTLTSPSGTTVTLMSRPGGTANSGNNFCKTVLSDSGLNSIQNIAVAGAPWTGTFKPASPLSAFSGQTASGTWILHVSDSVTIDTGGVRAFTLRMQGFTCTP